MFMMFVVAMSMMMHFRLVFRCVQHQKGGIGHFLQGARAVLRNQNSKIWLCDNLYILNVDTLYIQDDLGQIRAIENSHFVVDFSAPSFHSFGYLLL